MKHNFLLTTTHIAFLIFAIILALIYGKSFLLPLVVSALLSIAINPLTNKLEELGLSRGISSGLSIAIILVVLIILITILFYQLWGLLQNIPSLTKQFIEKIDDIQHLIQNIIGVSPELQIDYIKSYILSSLLTITNYTKELLFAITNTSATLALIGLYLFFFLYYKRKIITFIFIINNEYNNTNVQKVITNIGKVVSQYLLGMLILMTILASLLSIGLYIIGVKFALLWGISSAFLTFLPYIGFLIGSLSPIITNLLTQGSILKTIAIITLFSVMQFLEGNFLTPYIVGSQIKVNPLAIIFALVLGNTLWGIPGIILSIPILGIIKVICDNINALKPYGYLIGKNSNLPIIKKY